MQYNSIINDIISLRLIINFGLNLFSIFNFIEIETSILHSNGEDTVL